MPTLVVVVSLVVLWFLGSQFLGPGVGDETIVIVDGYKFSDAGGYEKLITYGEGAARQIVVDARVDSYKLKGDMLIVARRPRVASFEGNQDQVLTSHLSGSCEYWMLDVKNHRVEKTTDSSGLHCN